eukprot:13061956-Alexandrium_andersonii.AAC.1
MVGAILGEVTSDPGPPAASGRPRAVARLPPPASAGPTEGYACALARRGASSAAGIASSAHASLRVGSRACSACAVRR